MYALIKSILYSFTKLSIKKVTSVTKIQISAFRAGLQFIILLPYCQKISTNTKILPLSTDPWLQFKLVIRGIFGIAASVFYYYAIEILPLGDVSSLMFCQGFFTSAFSWIFLGENLDLIDIFLLCLSILGCGFISQPKMMIDYAFGNVTNEREVEQLLLGIKLACTGLAINGVSNTAIRGMKKQVHHSIVTFYYTIFGALTLWPILFFMGSIEFPIYSDLGLMVFIAMTGFICQSLMVKVFQHVSAFEASIYEVTEMIFCYILDLVAYDKVPTSWSMTGAFMIVVSAVSVAYKKYRENRSLGNKYKLLKDN